jgi:hypothetical protein
VSLGKHAAGKNPRNEDARLPSEENDVFSDLFVAEARSNVIASPACRRIVGKLLAGTSRSASGFAAYCCPSAPKCAAPLESLRPHFRNGRF